MKVSMELSENSPHKKRTKTERGKKLTIDEEMEICWLLENHHDIKDVADYYGRNFSTIFRVKKKYNVCLRSIEKTLDLITKEERAEK